MIAERLIRTGLVDNTGAIGELFGLLANLPLAFVPAAALNGILIIDYEAK
jgi:hypothetical protein